MKKLLFIGSTTGILLLTLGLPSLASWEVIGYDKSENPRVMPNAIL
jgi:hypothetical protein